MENHDPAGPLIHGAIPSACFTEGILQGTLLRIPSSALHGEAGVHKKSVKAAGDQAIHSRAQETLLPALRGRTAACFYFTTSAETALTAQTLTAPYKSPAKTIQRAGTGIVKSQEFLSLMNYRAFCTANNGMNKGSEPEASAIIVILKRVLSAIHIRH